VHLIYAIGCLFAALPFCAGSVQAVMAGPETPSPGGEQAVTLIKIPSETAMSRKSSASPPERRARRIYR